MIIAGIPNQISFQRSPCESRHLRSENDEADTEEASISGQADSSCHNDILEWAKVGDIEVDNAAFTVQTSQGTLRGKAEVEYGLFVLRFMYDIVKSCTTVEDLEKEVDPSVENEDNGQDNFVSELANAIRGIDEAMSFVELLK